jgi:hypothetical protein
VKKVTLILWIFFKKVWHITISFLPVKLHYRFAIKEGSAPPPAGKPFEPLPVGVRVFFSSLASVC